MENYEEKLIKQTISQLNDQNLIIMLSSLEFKDKLGSFEPYFGTEFRLDTFDEEIKQSL